MKVYFKQSIRTARLILIILTVEITAISILYLSLKATGISENTSLLLSFFVLLGVVVLSLPFIFKYTGTLRDVSSDLIKSLPSQGWLLLKIDKLLSRKRLLQLSLIIIIIFVLGSLILLLGLANYAQEQTFLQNGMPSIGVITNNTDCSNIQTCVPVVRYTTQKGEVVVSPVHCCTVISICVLGRCVPKIVAIGEGNVPFKEGEQVTILYNPNNPKEVQIQSLNAKAFSFQTSRLLFFGIILIFVGLLSSALFIMLTIIKLISSILLAIINFSKLTDKVDMEIRKNRN